MADVLRVLAHRYWSLVAVTCGLNALSTVTGQGVTCTWSAAGGSPGCIPDPASLSVSPADLTAYLEASASTAECEKLQEGNTGCSEDSDACETVSFTDGSDNAICAPVSNKWTSEEEYMDIADAWEACKQGTGDECEQAAQDFFDMNTDCAACGEAAFQLLEAETDCNKFTTSSTCGGGMSAGSSAESPSSVSPSSTSPSTSPSSSPPTSSSPGVSPLAPKATGDIQAVCLWGTTQCQAFPVGDDGNAWMNAFLEFLECFGLNQGTASSTTGIRVSVSSSCPATAPSVCKTFFEEGPAPWCLPSRATWNSNLDFDRDMQWLTIECSNPTSECVAAAKSFFNSLGCPECAEEAEAFLLASPACKTAQTEEECTVDLAQEGGTLGPPSTSTSPTSPVPDSELSFGPDTRSVDDTSSESTDGTSDELFPDAAEEAPAGSIGGPQDVLAAAANHLYARLPASALMAAAVLGALLM